MILHYNQVQKFKTIYVKIDFWEVDFWPWKTIQFEPWMEKLYVGHHRILKSPVQYQHNQRAYCGQQWFKHRCYCRETLNSET